MRKEKSILLKAVSELAYATASKQANSNCWYMFYQSKLPEKVKALRKH